MPTRERSRHALSLRRCIISHKTPLDTLIGNAARLCDARRGVILRRDGDSYHGVAFYNASPELVDFIRRHPVTPGRHSITARVALERRTIHAKRRVLISFRFYIF